MAQLIDINRDNVFNWVLIIAVATYVFGLFTLQTPLGLLIFATSAIFMYIFVVATIMRILLSFVKKPKNKPDNLYALYLIIIALIAMIGANLFISALYGPWLALGLGLL